MQCAEMDIRTNKHTGTQAMPDLSGHIFWRGVVREITFFLWKLLKRNHEAFILPSLHQLYPQDYEIVGEGKF